MSVSPIMPALAFHKIVFPKSRKVDGKGACTSAVSFEEVPPTMAHTPTTQQSDNERPAAEIVIELQAAVVRLCAKYLPESEREDAAQDCLVHLLQIANHATPDRASLKTYLHTCARNYLIDTGRRLRRQKPTAPLDEERDVAPDQSGDRLIEELAGLIVAAPELHLSGFKARLIRTVIDYPHATGSELAEMLGLSVNTLWPALCRIREEISQLVHTRSA